jgi:hypothetical protein
MLASGRVAALLLGVSAFVGCGSEFQPHNATGGSSGSGPSGGAGGVASGGSSGKGGTANGGRAGTGGTSASGGTAASGGTSAAGGSGDGGSNAGAGGSSSGGTSGGSGGACSGELTLLTFQDGGFESQGLGWAGAGNYPEYASVMNAAARTGSYGAELDDTGPGVPGIEQKVLVGSEVFGKLVTVSAWVRLVSFPGLRLLLEANTAAGNHLGIEFADTDPANPEWQKLTTSLTVPASTDHLIVAVGSAVIDGNGIAYADDVMVCMDGFCSPCN